MNQIILSIASDTANGKLDGGSLREELLTSGLIAVALDKVSSKGDALTIDYRADLSTAEQDEVKAIVKAHEGVAQQQVLKVQTQHTTVPDLNLFVHGVAFEADTGTADEGKEGKVTEFDFPLPEEREIEGAMAHVHNHCPGDKLDFEFWLPAGVMGPDPVMVGRNGCDVYVPPTGVVPEIRSDTTKPLAPPVIVRIRYTCRRTEADPKPLVAVNFRWHRKDAV